MDKIVTEVKESEEWEEVKMNIWDLAMTKGVELGAQQGIQQGIQQGEMGKLIKQICKKLVKGYSSEEIADMLEEDVTIIQKIVEIAEKYAPEYDADKIYKQLYKDNEE